MEQFHQLMEVDEDPNLLIQPMEVDVNPDLAIQPMECYSQSEGPVSRCFELPRRPRRGGRQSNSNLAIVKWAGNVRKMDPDTRRQAAKKLKEIGGPCSRCQKKKIRCQPDPYDDFGPCRSCILASKCCPRFDFYYEISCQSSGLSVRSIEFDAQEVYRTVGESLHGLINEVENSASVDDFYDSIHQCHKNQVKHSEQVAQSEAEFVVSEMLKVIGPNDNFAYHTFNKAFRQAYNPLRRRKPISLVIGLQFAVLLSQWSQYITLGRYSDQDESKDTDSYADMLLQSRIPRFQELVKFWETDFDVEISEAEHLLLTFIWLLPLLRSSSNEEYHSLYRQQVHKSSLRQEM